MIPLIVETEIKKIHHNKLFKVICEKYKCKGESLVSFEEAEKQLFECIETKILNNNLHLVFKVIEK